MANHRESKAEQFEHDLIHRAIADAAFRAELVANPTAVVRRELGRVGGTLPITAVVRVLEESPGQVYIVLPPRGNAGGSYDPYRIGKP